MPVRVHINAVWSAAVRFLRGLARPSKAANLRKLHARGETPASFTIRDATPEDVPAIARLHVATFDQTHAGPFDQGPSFELRARQWRQMFLTDEDWFCFLVQRPNGELVGFAKGLPYSHPTRPAYAGELNKIYLLQEYQRLGLGRRLLGHVARRFLRQGISSMLLFGEASNPSNAFYEALGAERLLSPTGQFHGAYGWRDLNHLAALCPLE